MKYLRFREFFKSQAVFSKKDLNLFDSEARDFDLNILSDWQKKGYIEKIRKGFYVFTDVEKSDTLIYHMSNKIYSPSYISFEVALSIYGLIPETVFAMTSASTKKTQSFHHKKFGSFYYKHIKTNLYFGYQITEHKGLKYIMADREKAVLDYFYIYPYLKSKKDFDDARFDYELFFEECDEEKLDDYLNRFNNKALSKRISELKKAAKGIQ